MVEFRLGQHRKDTHPRVVHGRFPLIHETHLIQKSDRPRKGYRLVDIFSRKSGTTSSDTAYLMSSKVISPSFKLIGVDAFDGSIATSVRSVLAQTGVFARFGLSPECHVHVVH
jgi:hypothetical protein